MLTNYSTLRILESLFGKSSYATLGPNAYLGLSTTEPSIDGTGATEPSGNGYSRVLLGVYSQALTQKMGTPVDGEIQNSVEIHFNKSTGAWASGASIPYAVLYDAATGGNMLAYMDLTTAITVTGANVIPVISVGDLSFSFTEGS